MVCTPLFLKAVPQITGNLQGDGRFAYAGANFVVRDTVTFDELFKQLVIEFGNHLDHLLAVFLGLLQHVVGIGSVSYSEPSVSSRQMTAFISPGR